MSKGLKRFLILLIVVGAGVAGVFFWMKSGISPTAKGKPFYLRFEKNQSLPSALRVLEERDVVRSPSALRLYAWLNRRPALVKEGTYRFAGGMSADEVLAALQKPVVQMVRIPETNWAKRTAKLLAKKDVVDADEYMRLVRQPDAFKASASFPLPKHSLEGYLYPDTYDLPPQIGARGVIERQIRAFDRKVWPQLKASKNPRRTLIVASLVELEVASNAERAIVAGVIENRLKKGMPLQLDASVLYAMGEWKALTQAEIKSTVSPYNTYLNKGLPPGPICSPSLASIEGALKPAKHEYLFYVVNPSKPSTHAFAKTYAEHLVNVRKLRAAQRAASQ